MSRLFQLIWQRSRLYSLFLASFLILLTGCQLNLFEQPSLMRGRLLIYHPFQGENGIIFENFLDNFEQLYPEVQLLSEYIREDRLSQQFISKSRAGLGATVLIDFARHIPQLVKSNSIQPLEDKNIDTSRFLSSNIIQSRYQGKIYGIPLVSQVRVLCYNLAKLQPNSNTQDPILTQPPFGLEGLLTRAKKGYSVGMVSSFEDTFWGLGIFGAKFFDNQGFINPQLEGWGKWLEWLKKAETQPNFILSRNREILHEAFAKGKLTYYVCNSDEIGDLKNILKENLQIVFLPGEPDHPATPLLYTIVMMVNNSASLHETELALQWAQFMTNPEQQLKALIGSLNFIPTNQKISVNQQLLPIEATLHKQSKMALTIPIDSIEKILKIFQEGEIVYQKAMAGDLTSSQAVQELTDIIKTQLNFQTRN
ncbi:extracellular solute-binding protein family 1 [Rippkaea orientalis PCC 8801]|uniref:Extracellular solute-binding protein family 1 n=1 Tax=Rippkaea orientalis (strain PCC 8801 / RF-1) TaxID=41431 RepID=B7JYW9_RIPO1|nr:ABC transporter substrate-binding protein [Rippkaea orientalis]ACK66046.1 extracellular solute-binding protein family 1 [Rippkaea orientalis PCC 8801]